MRLVTIFSALFFSASAALAATPSTAPAVRDAKPASIKALHGIFKGKTWRWADGAAYFRPDGRFVAYSGKGEKSSYISGGWGAYRDGKICFTGTWRAAEGNGYRSTCFRHAVNGGVVYQQKPNGEWYVFKNAAVQSSDEINQIVAGDQVSAAYKDVRKTVIEGRKSQKLAQKLAKRKSQPTG